jgi:hypothetical protein
MAPVSQRTYRAVPSRAERLRLQRARLATALALVLLLVLQAIALVRQRPPFLEDDGAFFLRYAENLAAGNGYRWNAGEAPVWGASAPLWPVLLASGIAAGLSPLASTLAWSWVLTLSATLLLGLSVRRLFGLVGLLALAPLLAFNFLYSTWATSGMESPLTYLVVAWALYVVSANAGAVACGLAAGLCLVHKIDLVPLGLTLLLALAIWRRPRFARASLTALAVAVIGYSLAAWYFGSPVPNSFLRKLHASYAEMPRRWFADMALFNGAGWVRVPLLSAGALALRRRPEVAAVALAAVLVPTAAYTLKPPAEGFSWYPAAISGAIAFLAAGGFAFLVERIPAVPWPHQRWLATTAMLGVLAFLLESGEAPRVRGWHRFLAATIPTMRAGGEWVDAHLPADARVLTWWGHPARESRRFVYDGTFLNRRPEDGDLCVKYSPEAIIQLVQVPLADHRVPRGYRRAQVFLPPDQPFIAFTAVAVLVRNGVPVDGVVGPTSLRASRVQLARALLTEDEVGDDGLDPREIDALASLVEARRKRPRPPRWIDRLERRIQEVQVARRETE